MVNRRAPYEKSLDHFAISSNQRYLLDEYSIKNTKSPSEVFCGSQKNNVIWNCPICKSEYNMGTYYRAKMKCGCPYCTGKRVNNTNSLLSKFPIISKEWHPKKNGSLTPNDITYGSNKVVWWLCKKGHEWQMAVCDRTLTIKQKCPYCSGKRVSEENSLASIHPNIMIDWDYDKNKINPHEISFSSREEVYWICENNHSYRKSVLNKTRSPKCKICNSLAFKSPYLLNEWDYDKNKINPYEISFKSGKKVWWVCKNNKSHTWETSPHKRNNGRDCPICNESKGEKQIREWFEDNDICFVSQKEYSGLIGLRGYRLSYDFYVPELNILIEYQGEFHDGTANRQTDEEYIIQQEHDRRKCEYADQNGIKLLEIWYWDFNNVEEILNREINKH